MRRICLAYARLRQQLQPDAAHHDAVVLDIRNAIEIGQPDRRDDAAGKARTLDEHGPRAIARRGERRGQPGTTAATDEHIGFQRGPFRARFGSGSRAGNDSGAGVNSPNRLSTARNDGADEADSISTTRWSTAS